MSKDDDDAPLSLASQTLNEQFHSLETFDSITADVLHPEACVDALKDPWQAAAVKKQIKTADSTWIRAFLDAGGLDALWNTLDTCVSDEIVRPTVILRCIECCKALLSHDEALNLLILRASLTKYVNQLLFVIDLPANHALIKIYPLLMLSIIARHSEEGYRATLSAFDNYKVVKQLRHRFSILMMELSNEFSPNEYQAVIVAFINYLIASCENITERLKLRSAFNALQLPEILHELCENDPQQCLLVQIQIYRKKKEQDDQYLETPGGINLNNHDDVYRAVFEKFFDTENSALLLSVLQKLLLLERDSPKTETIFQHVDSFLDKALAISDSSQAEHVFKISVDKLKNAIEKEEIRKKEPSPIQEKSDRHESHSSPLLPEAASFLSKVTSTSSAPAPVLLPPPSPPPPPPFLYNDVSLPPAPPSTPDSTVPPVPLPHSSTLTSNDANLAKHVHVKSRLVQGVSRIVLSIFQRSRQAKPSVKMKRMNWKKVDELRAYKNNTLWNLVHVDNLDIDFDLDAIKESVEKFFSNEFRGITQLMTDSPGPKQVELDSQTQMNVNIILNDLKSVPTSLISDMLREGLSHPSHCLAAHHYDTIEKTLEKKEAISLAEFDGDVGTLKKAELFVHEISKIPWCRFRVKIQKFQLTFDESVEHYSSLYDMIMIGFDELLGAQSLKQVFFIILLIGNVINGNNNQGNAFGFTLTSLDQLTALIANVSTKGINFIHFLITVLHADFPHLLDFPSELPHMQELSNIPFKDITKEVTALREELTGYKETLEGGEPPSDLSVQMNSFIPNTDSKLSQLEKYIKEVEEKSKIVAEYFCDERDDFINQIFSEMWKFIEVFEKCRQDVVQNQPIPSLKAKVGDNNEEMEQTKEPSDNEFIHTKAAIEAITREDIEIVALHESEEVYSENDDNTIEEEKENIEQLRPAHVVSHAAPSFVPRRFSMFAPNRSLSRYKNSTFVKSRSLSLTASDFKHQNMFGSSIQDVERVLHRMADAIKKDLQIL